MSNFPAFPVIGGGVNSMGMTLRDYFAAKALNALLFDPNADAADIGMPDTYARMAYEYADAMLKARQR